MTDHPSFSERIGDKVRCTVCPRHCELDEGQRGFCFVRQRQSDHVVSTTYGRSSGFVMDPIEKKPLYHFHPGTPVLSFGTAGCNLGCHFCQNWDMTKSRQLDILQSEATPGAIARAAVATGARSVAYTYNDPVIFIEYAVDTALACREKDIFNVAVTAGYITPEAAEHFFPFMDAANIDLKAFSENFYHKLCAGALAPVLETLEYVVRETDCWLEITTLLIPGENDSDEDLDLLTRWVAEHLGPTVPLHFSAFHPDYRLDRHPPTSLTILRRAVKWAHSNGLLHVYLGNVRSTEGSQTLCPHCGASLIGRSGYRITHWNLDDEGRCTTCGNRCEGRFSGPPGHWGTRYERVDISRFAT